MEFPPQSPDVNPIENLWDHLKREKMRHTVTSKDMLWAVLCGQKKNSFSKIAVVINEQKHNLVAQCYHKLDVVCRHVL